MITLDRINNRIGTFFGIDAAPPAGSSSATVAADVPAAEIVDSSNWVRIDVEADFGLGFKLVKRGVAWQGGPGRSAPSTTYPFDPSMPPRAVRGVLVNGLKGNGPPASPAVCGLFMTFS